MAETSHSKEAQRRAREAKRAAALRENLGRRRVQKQERNKDDDRTKPA